MSNFKVCVLHEHEEKIAAYCAQKNIDFNQANAYDIVLETFKDEPIIYKTLERETGKEVEHIVTRQVARLVECQNRTVERIGEKIELQKIKFKQKTWAKNIQRAELYSNPNLDILTENLYRLNIVDENSYLALVLFLMQLKHSRNNQVPENDKTCVFFNGVARNGKSATARAICDVEEQYGEVFKAQSGKILESTHEEQVWKSHLNYFDEVKPTDIDRELLLTIVNGGNVELNPKNKKAYNHLVNTNNIFTSNDQINLMQRRVSIIKFGNRLNGRPLGEGTLKEIITNIMNSLPVFDKYYDIYNKVSVYNENKLNPLAIESILTFLNTKLSFVSEEKTATLNQYTNFSAHDIYSCIKDSYNKQIISAERRDAIRNALEYFVEKGLMRPVTYKTGTTKNYSITGENYLKIMEEYSKLNTKEEKNNKISLQDLKKSLHPYFDVSDTNPDSEPTSQDDEKQKSPDSSCDDDTSPVVDKVLNLTEHDILKKDYYTPYMVNNHTRIIAKKLYQELLNQIDILIDDLPQRDLFSPLDDIMKRVVNEYITKNMCETITLDLLTRTLKGCLPDFNQEYEALLKEKYTHTCCLWENGTVDYGESRKIKSLDELKPERDKTYTKLTPQEDGSLLAEECSCADIDNENEYKIDEEDYWSGYKTSYEQNMKIRNEKLGQLFHELGKLPEGRTANEPETSQNEVVQDKCVLPSNDDEDYIPF